MRGGGWEGALRARSRRFPPDLENEGVHVRSVCAVVLVPVDLRREIPSDVLREQLDDEPVQEARDVRTVRFAVSPVRINKGLEGDCV